MVAESIFMSMIFWIVGLIVFYFVIMTAVKDGINKSVIGQYMEKEHQIVPPERQSFLDKDLDN